MSGGAPRIRELRAEDAAAAAMLHEAELPHGFFPRLGVAFLQEYYRGFALSPHAIGLVADRDAALVGLVVGMTDRRQHFVWLLRHRAARLAVRALLSLLRRPLSLAPLFAARLRRYARWVARTLTQPAGGSAGDAPPPAAVLAHVAIAPHARSQGIGSALVDTFLEGSAAAGHASVRVTTLDGRDGAAEFYQRTGWTRQASSIDWDGERILVFSRVVEPAADVPSGRADLPDNRGDRQWRRL